MKFSLLFVLLFATSLFASTHLINIKPGDVYEGLEIYNYKDTGKPCRMEILEVGTLDERGLHCTKALIKFSFTTKNSKLPTGEILITSRVTNSHLPEYPGVKTCASATLNDEGRPYEIDIYGEETPEMFNRMLFYSEKPSRFTTANLFLQLSYWDKTPEEFSFHLIKLMSEVNWRCVSLGKI